MARVPPKLNFGEPPRRRDLNLNLDANFRRNENNDTDIRFNEIMNRTGKITIDGNEYRTDIDDLEHLGELGNGTCGHVVKMRHKVTSEIIAVKQMRRSGNTDENKRIIMDLEVVLKSHDCPYIVKCLGCIITDSEVWICMELMATCMDKLLKHLKGPLPEPILGKVAVATVKALHYLKESHGVIHRDIKPSNILLDEKGNVKLCDFGISGQLVDSKAKTRSAGCAAYMAPERINPEDPTKPTYDIRADVWSLGITCVELGTGRFPYSDCSTDFEVMARILDDEPPSLPENSTKFTGEFRSFVRVCLAKNYRDRPKYKELLRHEFIRINEEKSVDVSTWYKIYCGSRKTPHSNSSGFNNLGRHSGRMRTTQSVSSSGRLGSAGSPSPITPSPGSGRSRQEDWFLQSPRGLRSGFDRLNSDPSPNARTPSTPGTPSPLQGLPPDPPPRLSRMSSEGLRTPTPTSSSGIGSSSSGSGLLMSPSPTTSLSMANSTPSPEIPPPQPPMRRYFPSRLFFTPEPTRKRFFDFNSPPPPPPRSQTQPQNFGN